MPRRSDIKVLYTDIIKAGPFVHFCKKRLNAASRLLRSQLYKTVAAEQQLGVLSFVGSLVFSTPSGAHLVILTLSQGQRVGDSQPLGLGWVSVVLGGGHAASYFNVCVPAFLSP